MRILKGNGRELMKPQRLDLSSGATIERKLSRRWRQRNESERWRMATIRVESYEWLVADGGGGFVVVVEGEM